MQVTATQAKNRFRAICTHAKTEPVFVEKDGRVDTVIVSAQQFEALRSAGQNKTLAQRRRLFDQAHKRWLDEQNTRVANNGLWCDDLRVW